MHHQTHHTTAYTHSLSIHPQHTPHFDLQEGMQLQLPHQQATNFLAISMNTNIHAAKLCSLTQQQHTPAEQLAAPPGCTPYTNTIYGCTSPPRSNLQLSSSLLQSTTNKPQGASTSVSLSARAQLHTYATSNHDAVHGVQQLLQGACQLREGLVQLLQGVVQGVPLQLQDVAQ